MSRLSYWKDANTWVCSKHLPSIEIPSSIGACPFVGCDSIRPRHGRPAPTTSDAATPSASPAPSSARQSTPTKAARQTPATPVTTAAPATPSKEIVLCSWFKCDKGADGGPAPARARSKYCSKDCSNKNARYRYKTKQK